MLSMSNETMSTNFCSIPLKKTYPLATLTKDLTKLLSERYPTKNWNEDVIAFVKLREDVVKRSSLDACGDSVLAFRRYYDQCDESRRRLGDFKNVSFKWNDCYSLSGPAKPRELKGVGFDVICCVFSMGAALSQVACRSLAENFTDDALKEAAKQFQEAAGCFEYISTQSEFLLFGAESPLDLRPSIASTLRAIMIAQAQECFTLKAKNDARSATILARLSARVVELYTEAIKLVSAESTKKIWPKEWRPLFRSKDLAYKSMMQYWQSIVCQESKMFGEQIARLRISRSEMEACEKCTPKKQFRYADEKQLITEGLELAEKDNNYIYNDIVPEADSLISVQAAVLAKPAKFEHPLTGGEFKYLFEKPEEEPSGPASVPPKKGDKCSIS